MTTPSSPIEEVVAVRVGMKCWHGADELVCTAMDEGGHAYFKCPTHGTVQRLHLDEVDARSPFGNFVRLRDVPVGATFYWEDSTHWRSLQLMSFQPDYVCTLPIRGGHVFIENAHLDRLVSYFPPEWCGDGWSLNPFTRELFIKIPPGVRTPASEHRTRNQKEVEEHVNKTWAIYPGLYYAFNFLKNAPDFLFHIPHFEYSVWTPAIDDWAPTYCWTRAEAIPPCGVVPACWKRGLCTASLASPDVVCGWYMNADGVRFTYTNWKVPYGAERLYIVSLRQLRFGDVNVSFKTDADLQAFEDAYFSNSMDYTGVAPTTRVQTIEMCAGAGVSSTNA